jgi:hypothetical protein
MIIRLTQFERLPEKADDGTDRDCDAIRNRHGVLRFERWHGVHLTSTDRLQRQSPHDQKGPGETRTEASALKGNRDGDHAAHEGGCEKGNESAERSEESSYCSKQLHVAPSHPLEHEQRKGKEKREKGTQESAEESLDATDGKAQHESDGQSAYRDEVRYSACPDIESRTECDGQDQSDCAEIHGWSPEPNVCCNAREGEPDSAAPPERASP